MLRNIPEIISPELMKIMMEMGHGDEICLGDANFPAAAMAKRLVRADAHTVSELLEAMLQFFPLDTFVEQPCVVMAAPPGDEPVVWEKFKGIIQSRDFTGGFKHDFEYVERFEFYERSKNCFAILATSEHEAYSNIILKKGVIFK